MKKMKLMVTAMCVVTIGLFSFKENKVLKSNNTLKQVVATDGRYFDESSNAVDSGGKKKRKDTTSMPPDTMATKKPMDSLNNRK